MAELVRFRNVVDGQPCESATGRWLATTNPYTGEDWAEVPRCGAEDANAAVDAAWRAFTKGPWTRMNATARGKLLRRLGDLIARDAERRMTRFEDLHEYEQEHELAHGDHEGQPGRLPLDEPAVDREVQRHTHEVVDADRHDPTRVVRRERDDQREQRREYEREGACLHAP